MLTCKQVRELIHSLPLAEQPHRQLEAAEAHGRGCSRCRADLAELKNVEASLSRLPDPSFSPELATLILQKTSQVSPTDRGGPDPFSSDDQPRLRQIQSGIAALVGALVVAVTYSYQLLSGELSLDFASVKTRPVGSLISSSSLEPTTLVLAMGLLLLFGGLLAFESRSRLSDLQQS